MKLLSIVVPCYNSQEYMEHCIESLLPGGTEVEILIVDDGSRDDTARIADRLAAAHPDVIRAIKKMPATAAPSTRVSPMQPVCFSRWSTATTGWMRTPTGAF